ncbi:CHASE2 domain-containing protein [Propionivibrio sp.]|uniref:CHASE2 domain-containing protein n=1 Tax=Propionivibrio sp. TaxID=2212460 RepID=UPI003BF204AD
MRLLIARMKKIFLAGQGRPAAAGILLWMLFASLISEADLPAWWSESLPGQAMEMAAHPFKTGRQFLFDGYQRAFPRQPVLQPVTVVAIDEQSLKQIGQWPWPRNRLADLIDAIGKLQPAAIGLDMYMPEVDQTSPDRVAANLPPEQAELARALARLPSHETRLAQSLHAVPSVLGATGFDFSTYSTSSGMRSVPLSAHGGDPLPWLKNYPFVLASLPELQAAAHGQAMLSFSRYEGGVVRRVPLVLAVNDQAVPGMAIEMLRVASGSSAIEMEVGNQGIDAVQVAEFRVPTQSDGEVWLHFARFKTSKPRTLSAADVLAGKADPDRIAGKLVLVGLTGSGLVDMRMTPLGDLVPGVEIQAQLIESFFDGRFILRPWWMKWLETAMMGLIGLIMIWSIPRTEGKVAEVLKKSPHAPTWAVLGLNALIISVGYLVFYSTGLMFDSASTFIGLSSVLGSLISSAMIEIDRQTRLIEADRQRLRENEARMAGEMAAARRIQLGSLPDPVRVFAGEQRFELATYLEPARDVGGDLYDFFMIDARRLCFVVGDVSGKGVPASLFMAIAKTLTKSISLLVDEGLGTIVTLANKELARENAELLFVTLLIGVLDVESGELSLVNAGHDGPWRIAVDGSSEQIGGPPGAGGPPLCVIDDFEYVAQSVRLSPGDTLCLITDGITEAFNSGHEAYGKERLLDVLKAASPGGNPTEIVQRVKDDLAAFVGAALASDDMTLLVLRWGGLGRS